MIFTELEVQQIINSCLCMGNPKDENSLWQYVNGEGFIEKSLTFTQKLIEIKKNDKKISAERDLNEYLLSNQVKVTEPQIWNSYTFQAWLDDVVLFMKRLKLGSAKEQLITAKTAVEKLLDEDARKTANAIDAIKELNILENMFV